MAKLSKKDKTLVYKVRRPKTAKYVKTITKKDGSVWVISKRHTDETLMVETYS